MEGQPEGRGEEEDEREEGGRSEGIRDKGEESKEEGRKKGLINCVYCTELAHTSADHAYFNLCH